MLFVRPLILRARNKKSNGDFHRLEEERHIINQADMGADHDTSPDGSDQKDGEEEPRFDFGEVRWSNSQNKIFDGSFVFC